MTNKRGKESPEPSPTADDKKRKKAIQPNPGDIAHSPVAQQVESNLGAHDISSSNDSEMIHSCNDDDNDEDRYVSTALPPSPHEGRNVATTLKPLIPNEEMDIISTRPQNANSQTSTDIHPNYDLNKPAQINLSGPNINDILPSDARKLFLTRTDTGTKLASMNPILLSKNLNNLAGPVKDIQYLKSGSLFVTCNSPSQMTTLLDISELTMNSITIPIKFSLALADQSVQGKIYAPNLKDVTNDEILNELACYKVIKVEKLLKDPLKSHVPLYLLTFLGTACPPTIRVASCQYKVDKFIPGYIKCTNCSKFGHSKKYCSSQPSCGKCSQKGHLTINCPADTLVCPHCNGNHAAFSIDCRRARDENQINLIKHTKNISYFEARDQFFATIDNVCVPPRSRQKTDPLRLRSPDRPTFQPNPLDFPPLSKSRTASKTPNSFITEDQGNRTFDSTRFTPNQVADSPYSIVHTPFILSQNKKKQLSNVHTTSSPMPRLSEFEHSQSSNMPLPIRHGPKTPPEPVEAISQSAFIFKEVVKLLIPTIVRLSLCDTLTSKIEILRDIGSTLKIDDTITEIIDEMNPSFANSQ